jgi:hypothetical protein
VTRAPTIPETIPKPRRCTICRDLDRLAYVDAQLAKGMSATYIARVLTERMTMPTSPEVILSHAKHYVAPVPVQATKAEDLAILVRDRTVEAMKEGRLEPTIQHGLQAQALLDKRAEKTSDRELAITMARLLSGAGAPVAFLPPPQLVIGPDIEGEARDLDEDE